MLIKFTKDVFQIYIASDDNAKKFLMSVCEWPIFLLLRVRSIFKAWHHFSKCTDFHLFTTVSEKF